MRIDIVEESLSALADHSGISMAFQVERVLDITERDGQLSLSERVVDKPYPKDYDQLESPATWANQFDLTHWGLLGAFFQYQRVGGAVIAFDSPQVKGLGSRRDLAMLWDIRVDPAYRRHGVGSALFRAVEDWAASRGCSELRIETQNTNLPACRFYERMGCRLMEINPDAYPALPDDVQLIWSKTPRPL